MEIITNSHWTIGLLKIDMKLSAAK